jgi:hypothetical protein
MIQVVDFDVEGLRKRLAVMPVEILRKFGQAAAYLVSPKANQGHPPREEFVLQLEEARLEWKRRKME